MTSIEWHRSAEDGQVLVDIGLDPPNAEEFIYVCTLEEARDIYEKLGEVLDSIGDLE